MSKAKTSERGTTMLTTDDLQRHARIIATARGVTDWQPLPSAADVHADPERGARIAAAYMSAPTDTPDARASFAYFADDIQAQYVYMVTVVGLTHAVVGSDPYVTRSGAPNSLAMRRDVESGRIATLATATTGPHPYLPDWLNDRFRAVHDVFGHAATGANFSADGEECAWLSHRRMFSPRARAAMTAETRGQNSVNNFGGLPAGAYAPQRVAILPDWCDAP